MDGGPGDRLGSVASVERHRARRNELVQGGGQDVPWAWVLGRVARLDRKEGRCEKVGFVLGEAKVATPDRLEPSDRPGAQVGLVNSFYLVQHPASEVPPSESSNLAQQSLTIRKVPIDGRRRHPDAPRDLAEGDGVRSTRTGEFAGLGQEGPAEVAGSGRFFGAEWQERKIREVMEREQRQSR